MRASVRDTTVPHFNPPAEPARTVGFGKWDLEKRDSINGIRKNEIRKNEIRTTHAPAVLSVGRARGRAGPAGQGPNKEYKIRKNKTYKTSHWPKVTGTHGGLHSGLRPRAPTSYT